MANMFPLCMFLLRIELVIKWNHIQGGSTGQMLPFVVSFGSLVGVACHLFLKIACVGADAL